MSKKIIYIKLKTGCEPIEKFEESYDLYKKGNNDFNRRFYGLTNDTDYGIVEGEEYYICALVYLEKIENLRKKCVYTAAYLGIAKFVSMNTQLYHIIQAKLEKGTALDILIKINDLDINSDFTIKYVFVEDSDYIAQQIESIINLPVEFQRKERNYDSLGDKEKLHELAQRNEYCDRQYNLREPQSDRGEFQRDYERILHSKAFRRMVDKAQVFSASKGDYYRTRMTHSQAVAQIARGIASELDLNMNLTEAIALGHDIGHTPFGHQGERTLDDILNNKIQIINNYDELNGLGGFKHNYQSVRVATFLEDEYYEINGMDLSFQTLEGMLKHTKTSPKYDLTQFINYDEAKDKLHMEHSFCSTLEGQVVALADEIAQRGHDLDDALSSGLISFNDFQKFLTVKKVGCLKEKIDEISEGMKRYIENNHCRVVDENEMLISRTVSAILSFFIKDAIEESKKQMAEYSVEDFNDNGHVVGKEIIRLSVNAKPICSYLETVVKNLVINSSEVALFDSNAETIVKGLFKAYYNNPKLLHKGTLRRMYIEMRKYTTNVVDFERGNHIAVKEELSRITKTIVRNSKVKHKTDSPYIILPDDDFDEYLIKRKILVRCICDFISGMTDTYATNEYNRIVK